MLTYSKDEIEKIRHLIAEGAHKEAIYALYPIVADDNELQDTVVMLKNRLATLQKSVREGTIARDEENVERNMINRALLDTLNILEDANERPKNTLADNRPNKDEISIETSTQSSVTDSVVDSKKPLVQPQWLLKGLLALATILVTVLIERQINNWLGGGSSSDKDLMVRLVFRPEYPGISRVGMAKVTMGKFSSALLPISPDGKFHFADIPAKYADDTVKVELPDFKYRYKVTGQSALNLKKSNEITFSLELLTNTYEGKVLYPNSEPAAGVIIEIENEPARDTTDASGHYALTLPVSESRTIWVVFRRPGKPIERQDVALNAEVLKELTIPY